MDELDVVQQVVDRRQGQGEAHIRTILLGLITVGIIALVTVTMQARETLARLDERLNGLNQQLVSITAVLRDAETRPEHNSDIQHVTGRLDGVERRVDRLEEKK